MAKLMLIDAAHSEETRVAVIHNNKLQEFDFETKSKPNIKSNIYLAKVIRVEPSLQAAFVEFGKNRHGFLAFSEIHPDYYRIPVSDRQNLEEESELIEPAVVENEMETTEPEIEILGGEDAEEFPRIRSHRKYKHYKIQEVIKRRQIMLVQVIKEERQSKRAALTTYLSLAGRYCVLMPNAGKGGGISRKITDTKDRKRLKTIIEGLNVPEGMGMIIRTAGMDRTKGEIIRDFDYLLELWEDIRELTLKSIAPTLIHAEGALITRTLRDLYTKDIDRIIVEGEAGYEKARNFIRKLIPSHVKKIEMYKADQGGVFQQYNIEEQIDAIHQPIVPLPSGGYLIINPTEALVSIDVNSGKATRERHIEETALKTNLEAAEICAQQLRLRNLAGLVVIDFIDMEDQRNIIAVEKRLKETMAQDKARLQIGRISPFGLLELTRQRLRPSVLETSVHVCSHCQGSGTVRSIESLSIKALRTIEREIRGNSGKRLTVHLPPAIALYLLNEKKLNLLRLEEVYKIHLTIVTDPLLLEKENRIVWEEATEEDFLLDDKELEEKSIEEVEKQPLLKSRRREKSPEEGINSPSEQFYKEIEEESSSLQNEQENPLLSKVEEEGEEKAGNAAGRRRRRRKRRRERPDYPTDINVISSEGNEEQRGMLVKEGEEEKEESLKMNPRKGKEFYKKRSGFRFRKKLNEPKEHSEIDSSTLEKENFPVTAASSKKENTIKEESTKRAAPPVEQHSSAVEGEKRKGWWQRLLK